MTYISPTDGHAVWIESFGTIYKVLPESTPSHVAIVEHVLGPHQIGAPLHRHSREDEISHVLEGELTVQQGSEVATAVAGGTVVKPRGVFHTFWNAGAAPVRFLEIIAPGDFARYFEELATLIAPPAPPDMSRLASLAERYGVEFDFASLAELLERHGLRAG
jgi:quercetin dioxygenase-like cupin family protein